MQLVHEVHDTNGTNDFVYANKQIALSIRGLDMYAGCAAHFRLTAHGEILSDRTCMVQNNSKVTNEQIAR